MRHGGDLTDAKARHGAGDPPWLDLSTGINPRPWPVPDRLRTAGWERLPEAGDLRDLAAAARRAYGVPDQAGLAAAPGTQALIQWLPRLAPPGPVAVLGPTYGEHAASWRAAGAEMREVGRIEEAGEARHLVLVNPNNPDGRLLSRPALLAAARRRAELGGWLVVDESFADLLPEASVADLAAELPVVVLRSFGKFYGLAGLRLGFAAAPREIAGALETALGPWPVSGPAIAVGTAALADAGWADATRARLAAEAGALDRVLAGAGVAPAGGTSLFRFVRHPAAGEIHRALAARHVWVRSFAHAPDLLRFGLPPDPAGLERLAVALADAHAHGTITGASR